MTVREVEVGFALWMVASVIVALTLGRLIARANTPKEVPMDNTTDIPDNVVSIYTNDQAIADGIKVQMGDRLFVTTALAIELAPVPDDTTITDNDTGEPVLFDPRVLLAHIATVLDRYNAGDYGETGTWKFATYIVADRDVWAIVDGDGMTLLRPEDY